MSGSNFVIRWPGRGRQPKLVVPSDRGPLPARRRVGAGKRFLGALPLVRAVERRPQVGQQGGVARRFLEGLLVDADGALEVAGGVAAVALDQRVGRARGRGREQRCAEAGGRDEGGRAPRPAARKRARQHGAPLGQQP